EHILPRRSRGKTSLENLCLSCPHCNYSKGKRIWGSDPVRGETSRLFNPRSDSWSENFEWSADFEMLKGSTAVGRVTVRALNMNSTLMQLARKLWHTAGLIP